MAMAMAMATFFHSKAPVNAIERTQAVDFLMRMVIINSLKSNSHRRFIHHVFGKHFTTTTQPGCEFN